MPSVDTPGSDGLSSSSVPGFSGVSSPGVEEPPFPSSGLVEGVFSSFPPGVSVVPWFILSEWAVFALHEVVTRNMDNNIAIRNLFISLLSHLEARSSITDDEFWVLAEAFGVTLVPEFL